MSRFLNTTALCLIASLCVGAAYAQDDDNVAVIDQIGQDNSGLINQAGRLNIAGSDEDPILQDGFYNVLQIDQTGIGNEVGADPNGAGVDQIGDSATPSIFNEILIDQNSDNSFIGTILQAARGAIPEGANRLIIRQGEAGGGDDNIIITVIQEQLDGMPGQLADIAQTGEGNIIERVEQRSLTSAELEENEIIVRITGNFNGRGDLTGPALLSRAEDNALIQRIGYDGFGANGNTMSLLIDGDNNVFGVFQGGRKNSVGLVTISGNSNEVGLRQDGLENDIVMTPLLGDDNRIGVGQIGTNRAWVDVVGVDSDLNDILGLQEGTNDLRFYVEGSSNTLTADQGFHGGMGGDNDADFRVIGDANFFDLLQRGENTATFVVEGDLNNAAPAAFSGDAELDAGLLPGLFSQFGMGNTVLVTIEGDMNLMGATQTGNDNTITAIVMGNSNQAAFIQNGSLNEAWLNQTGTGNVAGIIQ